MQSIVRGTHLLPRRLDRRLGGEPARKREDYIGLLQLVRLICKRKCPTPMMSFSEACQSFGGLCPKDDAHLVRCAVIGERDRHAAACERCAIKRQQTIPPA